MENGYQATPHGALIEQIMDSRVPKNEREHAAAREIERLREEMSKMAQYSRPPTDNQTHVVGEVKPLKNGSDVLDRLMYLWATKKIMPTIGGQQCGLEQYMIRASGRDFEAIPDAGDRIIALERELERTRGELEGADALHEAEKQMHGKTRELLEQLREKYAAAQHAADCLEAKCNALEADYNRRPENEPIGMLLDFLSTRPRNIILVELAGLWPGEELTLGHLCKFTRSEVLRFPNLGKKSLREIEEYFRPRGVWWRGEA